MLLLTQEGKNEVDFYIRELKAKRKEILDAGLDTANETHLPTEKDILSDIAWSEDNGEYFNCWGVTDNYDADAPLVLNRGIHYIEI